MAPSNMRIPPVAPPTTGQITLEHLRFLDEARCARRQTLDGWEITRHPNLTRAAVDGGDAGVWRPLRSPAW
jgi:hypothetical protein